MKYCKICVFRGDQPMKMPVINKNRYILSDPITAINSKEFVAKKVNAHNPYERSITGILFDAATGTKTAERFFVRQTIVMGQEPGGYQVFGGGGICQKPEEFA